jgi:diphosphomevalonate decarboxylase
LKKSPLFFFQSGISSRPVKESGPIFAEWKSPSNIAFVKYWGKKEGQIPANPSLSMTLSSASTTTSVKAHPLGKNKFFLTVNGDPDHLFVPKLRKLVEWLSSEIPVLKQYSFEVKTSNTFPHSAGIASSASGMSAFSLCLLSIILKITGRDIPQNDFLRIASYISRMGSGSACRSVFGGYTLWGQEPGVPDSSDEYAISINDRIHPDLMKFHDAILVVSSSHKSLASSLGHELMRIHPFAQARYEQAGTNIHEVLNYLQSGDFDQLAEISENEALTLHSLIMTSPGGTILMEPNSLIIINNIKNARKHGIPVFFSLDAGPNVHLFYLDDRKEEVENFIRNELIGFCENGQVIFDHCGEGPALIKIDSQFFNE